MHTKFSENSGHKLMRPSLPRKAKANINHSLEKLNPNTNKTTKLKKDSKNNHIMAQAQISLDNIIHAFPTFDGKKNYDIENFIAQYETLAQEIKIPDSLKVILLKGKFIGPARETIFDNEDLNAENDFQTFKDKLFLHFRKEYSFEKSQNDFMTLKQEPTQKIEDFVKKFNAAANKYLKKSGLGDQQGAKKFLETVKLPKFLEQIRQDIARDVRKRGPTSFEEAVKIAKDIEAALEINPPEELNQINKEDSENGPYSAILALAKTQQENMKMLQEQINSLKLENKNENRTIKNRKFCEICEVSGHNISECWYNAKINKPQNKQQNLYNTDNSTQLNQAAPAHTPYAQQPYMPPFYMPTHTNNFQHPNYTHYWPQTVDTPYYNEHWGRNPRKNQANEQNYSQYQDWSTRDRPNRRQNDNTRDRQNFQNNDKREKQHRKFSEN